MICDLPVEVSSSILHFLDLRTIRTIIILINRFFHSLANNPLSYDHISLQSFRDNLTDDLLFQLTPLFSKLRALTLEDCTDLTNPALTAALRSCARLRSINLADVSNLGDSALEIIGQNCPQLTLLNTSFCFQFTDQGLAAVARGCPGLTQLKLRACRMRLDFLGEISFPSLEILDLSHCRTIPPENFRFFAPPFSCAPRLLKMMLWDCSFLSDTSLFYVCEGCPRLENVNCGGADAVTGEAVLAFSRMAHLHSVSLYGCVNISRDAIFQMICSLPRLHTLNLDRCAQIVDDALVMELARRHGPSLQRFEISICQQVTDQSLIYLFERCQQLSYLDIWGCVQITDAALVCLAEHCGATMTEIHFGDSRLISDRGVFALAQHCRRLVKFTMSQCLFVGQESLLAMATMCPDLERDTIRVWFGPEQTLLSWPPVFND
eukprot:TRINITY_DN12508_c0_g1_i2.p1 TRINITY_DN12508_c0_g1~~TRINITY_DN12508_c0_g1_i2.p1  ORF type:complete len:435 (+),score=69.01 TRINITY_DN12508_c0_g1_i2:59-1363(+)